MKLRVLEQNYDQNTVHFFVHTPGKRTRPKFVRSAPNPYTNVDVFKKHFSRRILKRIDCYSS